MGKLAVVTYYVVDSAGALYKFGTNAWKPGRERPDNWLCVVL